MLSSRQRTLSKASPGEWDTDSPVTQVLEKSRAPGQGYTCFKDSSAKDCNALLKSKGTELKAERNKSTVTSGSLSLFVCGVHLRGCVCLRMCMSRLHVGVCIFLPHLSLIFELKSLCEPDSVWAGLAGRQGPLVTALLRVCCHSWLLCGYWGYELRFSRLCGEQLTESSP